MKVNIIPGVKYSNKLIKKKFLEGFDDLQSICAVCMIVNFVGLDDFQRLSSILKPCLINQILY